MSEPTNSYFGKDCPKGMVQVEFVGVDPALRHSDYGWKPSGGAFLELWVDGERFRIDMGDVTGIDGKTRRGLHIFIPLGMGTTVRQDSVNTVSIVMEPK